MSIKVYYGLRITDYESFMEEVRTYKRELEVKGKKYGKRKYNVMDKYVSEYISEGMEVRDACLKFESQFRVNKTYRLIPFDNLYDLNFRIYEKGLVVPEFENNKVYEDVSNFKGIEEYGYWNNVDKLEEVSDEEWEKRGEEWDKALDNPYIRVQVYEETIDVGYYIREYRKKLGDE